MSIGNKLKEARDKKKLSIEQVYERTKIHPNIIKVLEEDEYRKVLNSTYIKIFLREYASFLGLDSKEILEEYSKALPKSTKKPLTTHTLASKTDKIDAAKALFKTLLPYVKWLIILILAFVLLRGAVNLARNIKMPKFTKGAKQAKVTQKTAAVEPKQEKAQAQEAPAAEIPKGKKLVLTITATDDAWLRLKVDGKTIFENILKKGTSENWEGKDSFVIWTARPDVLSVSLNNNSIDIPRKGPVKNLVIDRKGIK